MHSETPPEGRVSGRRLFSRASSTRPLLRPKRGYRDRNMALSWLLQADIQLRYCWTASQFASMVCSSSSLVSFVSVKRCVDLYLPRLPVFLFYLPFAQVDPAPLSSPFSIVVAFGSKSQFHRLGTGNGRENSISRRPGAFPIPRFMRHKPASTRLKLF